jgi:hypothetical protein
MKKIFLITITFFFGVQSYSQVDSSFYLKGYKSLNYIKYFDSLNNEKKDIVKNLDHSYSCYVIFKIYKSNIIDFEFIEIPKATLPDLVKEYIKNLFSTTNGMWINEKTENVNNDYKEVLFSVSLLKSNQSIRERLNDLKDEFEFTLIGLPKAKRLKNYELISHRNINLVY